MKPTKRITKKTTTTGTERAATRRAEIHASWQRNLAEGNHAAAAGDYECLRREFGVC